jgi:Tol biopolymer transport system component
MSRLVSGFLLAVCLAVTGAAQPANFKRSAGRILFECGGCPIGDGIYTMRPSGGGLHRVLSRLDASNTRWSLQGRRLVFLRGTHSGIWATGADGRHLRRITASQYDRSPAWSPDGHRIVFIRQLPTPTVYLDQPWIVDVNGRHAHRLSAKSVEAPDWSPDGKWIAFAAVPVGGPNRSLYVVHPDGTELRRLPWKGEYPRWSPDGKRLAFTRSTSHGWVATVLTVATDRARTINGDLNAPFVVWSPGGKDLLVSFWDRSAPNDEVYNVTKLAIQSGQRRFLLKHLASVGVDDWRR